MELSTGSYLTTLVIGIVITLVVGQLLRRAGHDFLLEVFGDRTLTTSLNHLLVTQYHLFALGLLGLVSTANPSTLLGVQLIITRTGFILLILGGVYGLTVLALTNARSRRQRHSIEDRIAGRDRRQ